MLGFPQLPYAQCQSVCWKDKSWEPGAPLEPNQHNNQQGKKAESFVKTH